MEFVQELFEKMSFLHDFWDQFQISYWEILKNVSKNLYVARRRFLRVLGDLQNHSKEYLVTPKVNFWLFYRPKLSRFCIKGFQTWKQRFLKEIVGIFGKKEPHFTKIFLKNFCNFLKRFLLHFWMNFIKVF